MVKKIWKMPSEMEEWRTHYMTVTDAIAAWGVSRATAYAWIARHPEIRCITRWQRDGKISEVTSISIGARMTRHRRGNPNWHIPAMQRALVSRRWQRMREIRAMGAQARADASRLGIPQLINRSAEGITLTITRTDPASDMAAAIDAARTADDQRAATPEQPVTDIPVDGRGIFF